MIKRCLFCFEHYETNNKKQNYCSAICAAKSIDEGSNSEMVIFRRDDMKCVYCGKSAKEHGIKLIIDHIYPLSKGGSSQLSNLVASCLSCNSAKGAKILNRKALTELRSANEIKNEMIPEGIRIRTYNYLINRYGK